MASQNDNNGHSVAGLRARASILKHVLKKPSAKSDSTSKVLMNVPLFAGLSQSEVGQFKEILHRRRFKTKEAIFRKGEPGAGLYIVQDGLVSLCDRNTEDQWEELARLGAGDFCGELSLLDESPRTATAIALQETKVLALFKPDLLGLVERQPRLGNKFLLQFAALLGEKLKQANSELLAIWSQDDVSKIIT